MAISLIDLIKFYCEKKEHYPISDEFMKKYQQKSGGGILNLLTKRTIQYPPSNASQIKSGIFLNRISHARLRKRAKTLSLI